MCRSWGLDYRTEAKDGPNEHGVRSDSKEAVPVTPSCGKITATEMQLKQSRLPGSS